MRYKGYDITLDNSFYVDIAGRMRQFATRTIADDDPKCHFMHTRLTDAIGFVRACDAQQRQYEEWERNKVR